MDQHDTRPPRGSPVPRALGAVTVLCQVAYPLVHGPPRSDLTVATVLLFFATSATHAWIWRGARWAGTFLVLSAGAGLLVEAVGVHTGWPFGRYRYTRTLGVELDGVPAVIPLAWAMMAYPALLVGRRIGATPLGATLAAAAALASWDLFLDPQMVRAGHWVWRRGSPTLLGIPLSNDLGWLVTAVLLMALLQAALPARAAAPGRDALPLALYLWTFASSVLANLAFFGTPAVALVGGIGMGAVVALLVRREAALGRTGLPGAAPLRSRPS